MFLAVFAAMTACTDFPALDAAISDRARAADYPDILPLGALIASVPAFQGGLGVGDLPARLASLHARAAALKSYPVIDAATRARMLAALARHR